MRLRNGRVFPAVIALIAWAALALQFFVMLRGVQQGRAQLLPAVAQFFCYFTILTNLQAAVVLTGAGFFRHWHKPAFAAATAVYIAIVGLGYSMLLRHLFEFTGLMQLADRLLHDLLPALFVAWWIAVAEKAALMWQNVLRFLVWPLLYFLFTLASGALTGWYPYPFVNARVLGYEKVAAIAAGFLAIAALLSAAAIAFSRRRAAVRAR